jgi:hypothetical protein
VTDPPVVHHIRGRSGRTLAEAWSPSMYAYRGTTVPDFPNLFFLLGPNTGLGHTSVVLMIEAQLQQVIRTLKHMRTNGIVAMEPTAGAQQEWSRTIDRKMRGTVWQTGCQSWYLDSTGRNTTIWPGFVTSFRLRMRQFRPSDYAVIPAREDSEKEHADAV